MQFTVRGKNIEVTNALREYVEKKVGKIEKYIDQPVNAQVNMYVERGKHIVEVTAALNGLVLRGEEGTDDMYASIDLVADKLERQVKKYKSRFSIRHRGKENGVAEAQPVVEQPEGKVVKTKRFPIKPMPVDEAMVQMDLLGHDFFVFINAESNQVNVLYKRRDGDYGLLQPDV